MKKLLISFVVFFGLINISLLAQNDSIAPQKVYRQASPFFVGYGGSIPKGILISVGGFSRHGWGGSLTYHFWGPDAKDLPKDYAGGSSIFGEGKDYVKDRINMTSFRILKVFALNSQSQDFLFGIEAGPSYVQSTSAENFISIPVSNVWGFYNRNYDYEIIKRTSFGLSLRGTIGLRISKFLGLDLGILSNINPVRSYLGMEISGTIGKFRRHKKA